MVKDYKKIYLPVFLILTLLSILIIPFSESFSFEKNFTFMGKGWGHGVGMSQWGAYAQANAGKDYQTIIKYYYQGVGIEKKTIPTTIKIGLLEGKSEVNIIANGGNAQIYVGASLIATSQANESWKVRMVGSNAQLINPNGTPVYTGSGPIKFVPQSDIVVLKIPQIGEIFNRFRANIITQIVSNSLTVINEIPLEKYLYGVVPSEMSGSWPLEALKPQALAARSFAVRNMGRHGIFDLCATTHCQVYHGYDNEYENSNIACANTEGDVITFNGDVISAYYHANSGGYTEDNDNVWGGTFLTYLKGVPDPYSENTPNYSWTETVSLSELQSRLGSSCPGNLIDIKILAYGVSPRVTSLQIIGSNGSNVIEGADNIRIKLGLRSAWFTVSPNLPRLAGETRYETAVEISKKGFDTAETVILARGDLFPDALAGVPLARQFNCPMLLTYPNILNDAASKEIARLKAKSVFLLGSGNAIGTEVIEGLKQKNKLVNENIHRLGGADRYETANIIAGMLNKPQNQTAIVATGENFPDALASAPLAAAQKMPILLTNNSQQINNNLLETLKKLDIKNTILVGGQDVVSSETENIIKQSGYNPMRIAGEDRYGTAINLAQHALSINALSVKILFIATGEDFPDALTAGPLAGKDEYKSPLVLTHKTVLVQETRDFISSNKSKINTLYLLGDKEAISENVEAEISSNLSSAMKGWNFFAKFANR